MQPGDILTLDVEKAVAGGRMLARRGGRVVLVTGAIPGERVEARVERVTAAVTYAETMDVIAASSDRVRVEGDWRCGGNAYVHIAYPRQLALKAAIVADAFVRIGRQPLTDPVFVHASPAHGYRMRARLHVTGAAIGFVRLGTHEVCDAAATGQLLPAATDAIEGVRRALLAAGSAFPNAMDLAENVEGTSRAVHLDMGRAAVPPASALADAGTLTGVVASGESVAETVLRGEPFVDDTLDLDGATVRLRRHVRAFFQGNRYLLATLVARTIEAVPRDAAVLDLYAGGGLFSIALAARGQERVTAVEGDAISGSDLRWNGRLYGKTLRTLRRAVEDYLRDRPSFDGTVVVDPPRTGLSPAASARIGATGARRIVYVSCDVATLARDVSALARSGYRLRHVEAFDLFPQTAHIETLAVVER
jgi:tRNA/tmRNA/rRNA uracil-C5-methylase (TrmA/RlmC/RlmD family)